VYVAGDPERRVSLAQVGQAGLRSRAATGLEAFACYDPPTEGIDSNFYGDYSSAYSYGAHAAEVEVDTETGFVRVLRVAAAHDVGFAINPRAVKGQILGGVAQGMGWALTENLVLKDGVIQNPSLSGYIIPTIADMPQVEPILVETHDPVGPFGAKGVGEPSLIPCTPAIANAVRDAVGVRVKSLPITPEKVFWGMRRLASGKGNPIPPLQEGGR
jgi:CO/xanthine dehydrogenase Mo-binding subunit